MHQEANSGRRWFGGLTFLAVAFALLLYLLFAGIRSEYGLMRQVRIEGDERRLHEELTGLQARRAALESRTLQLSENGLQMDMLEERARRVLGLGRSDELMLH
jgi:cell division protein FtsB